MIELITYLIQYFLFIKVDYINLCRVPLNGEKGTLRLVCGHYITRPLGGVLVRTLTLQC